MADVSLTILGLNRTGASVGLALERYNNSGRDHHFTVTAYDRNPETVKKAQQIKAIDKAVQRIEEAVREANIIVITMPYNELRDVYEIIAPAIRPGAVVIDMTPLKQNSMEWAAKFFKDGGHLICAEAIVNPNYLFDGLDTIDRASADLFDGGSMLLMPSTSSIKEAISLATDFSIILGSEPTFFDTAEYNALNVATSLLPALIGTSFFHMLSKSPGWDDAQRVTNSNFGTMTHHLYDTHPDDLTALWMDSSQDLVRNLNSLIDVLGQMRDAIQEQDRDAIESVVESASRDYEVWVNRRFKNKWQIAERLKSETPTFGSMMGNLMGNLFSRGDKNDKKS